MYEEIQILNKFKTGREKNIQSYFGKNLVKNIKICDTYKFNNNLNRKNYDLACELLYNPISQKIFNKRNIEEGLKKFGNFSWILEVGYLPGVTDNLGNTATEIVCEKLNINEKNFKIRSSQLFLVSVKDKSVIHDIAKEYSNSLVNKIELKKFNEFIKYKNNFLKKIRVNIEKKYITQSVNLNLTKSELKKIGKKGIKDKKGHRRGTLGLDIESLKVIKKYFDFKGRKPNDIEIETLAQTWSEHCKHKIFSSRVDGMKKGLFETYIKGATNEIIKKRKDNFCVSLFSDNAGGITFDKNWVICHKVETHNTPSALDPFGGALTGIVGVNRDCIGFGKGAKPICNTYGFCFSYPNKNYDLYRSKNKKDKLLSSRFIINGVINGVKVGGNCSGIPTPQGFIYFDDGYSAKPLVFCGTVGLIPKKIKNKFSHIKKANPGDKILMIGGRVGKDGIHGATFSSEELDTSSPVTAVQIGDPITQKKFSDVIIKELRDKNLYTSLTDNGAGGLSSSVGEMGKESGGFIVDLDLVPLKYSGLHPWEIWISESQERMTMAVPPKNEKKVIKLLNRRGVEVTTIGKFAKTSKAIVKFKNKEILNMEMNFLHEGYPRKIFKSKKPILIKKIFEEKKINNYANNLLKILSSPNVISKEFVSSQYDHEVQGTSIIKPLQGIGKVFSDSTVIKPIFNSSKCVGLSQGIYPNYTNFDSYNMAANCIDTAIRNLIVTGCELSNIALLDNFCWCSPEEPERLYQLKKSLEACYDLSLFFQTPFISGKDSMYNDFNGYDKKNNKVKISIPPTLLISSIGVINNQNNLQTIVPQNSNDLIYIIGETNNEMAGSEFSKIFGSKNNIVPSVNKKNAKENYNSFTKVNKNKLINSAISVGIGGLAVALAKMAIASQKGLSINLNNINLIEKKIEDNNILFSESPSRIIITINSRNQNKFERCFKNNQLLLIGKINGSNKITFNLKNKKKFSVSIKSLTKNYKRDLFKQ
jgi:phosphoribosylformylglycinamidine synthase